MTARSLIGCEGIAVILKDGDLCHYVEEDAIGPLWKGQKFPASACVSGWAMLNRETAVVPDIRADERIPYELYAGTFVRALAMAPVNVEAPIAAIGAYWSQPYSPRIGKLKRWKLLPRRRLQRWRTPKSSPHSPAPWRNPTASERNIQTRRSSRRT
jgi:GAF domain-containing protein